MLGVWGFKDEDSNNIIRQLHDPNHHNHYNHHNHNHNHYIVNTLPMHYTVQRQLSQNVAHPALVVRTPRVLQQTATLLLHWHYRGGIQGAVVVVVVTCSIDLIAEKHCLKYLQAPNMKP